jgi:putative ABC transport system permease protein
MLNALIHDRLALGIVQALVAALFALSVALFARTRGVPLAGEAVVSMLRGAVQIVTVGVVFVVLLRAPVWIAPLVLAGMIAAAAATSSRRARRYPGSFRLSLYAVGLGAGSVIALMAALGVIDLSVNSLIPVGSMIVANAMNANSLALDRFRSDVESHIGEIESALALGAAPEIAVRPYLQSALRASLIPPLDNLRSLGIVWIPGLMAGMLLAHDSPIYASIYQFVVLALILGSSGLTCSLSTWLISRRAFSPADQLIMRPATLTGQQSSRPIPRG